MDKPVSFELAILLKEKEFTVATFYYYENEKLVEPYLENGSSTDTDFIVYLLDLKVHFNKWSKKVSAPTIAEAIMWLYEKYGIWIQVHHWTNQPVNDELWKNCFCAYVNGDNMDAAIFKTPTEAYEAAIKYCLEKCI